MLAPLRRYAGAVTGQPPPTRDHVVLRRRAQRRHTSILVSALVLSTVAGLIVGVALLDPRPSTPEAERGLGALAWLIISAPLLLICVILVVLVRLQRQDRLSWLPGPSLALGTDRATRRRVVRSLRRGDLPADEPERGLVLDAARRTVAYRWARAIVLVAALLSAANAFVQNRPVLQAVAASTAVVLLANFVQQAALVRRARQVLAPAPPGPSPSATTRPRRSDRAHADPSAQ